MEDERQLLERALGYPYAVSPRSFALVGKRVVGLEEAEVDLSARIAVLAYGSNASPEVLARKLGASEDPVPVRRAELLDFDVVYSAHVSAYGAVPATLRPSPGTEVPVFVAHLTGEQLELLAPTEPNYSLERLAGIDLFPEATEGLDEALAYLSRHGPLRIGGEEVALAAIDARGRRLVTMGQRQVLESLRDAHRPGEALEQFVLGCASGAIRLPVPLEGPEAA